MSILCSMARLLDGVLFTLVMDKDAETQRQLLSRWSTGQQSHTQKVMSSTLVYQLTFENL